MSHPNSPRVSTDSAAASALSHAGDEQAQTSGTADNNADAAYDTTTSGPAGQSQDDAAQGGGVSHLISQAQRWLQDSSLPTMLSQVPAPLKRVASQAGNRLSRLSPTQLAVGGALVAAGSWYLLSRSKSSGKRSSGSQAGTLHELLLFVNDRVEGYRRASSESQDADLRSYYLQLADQSKQFSGKLNTYLRQQGGGEETGTTLKGKLYRAWMEAKAAITGYSEAAVLGSNVYGEEWALKAYEEALADHTLTGALRSEVQRQYAQSQQTYQKLQRLQAQQK